MRRNFLSRLNRKFDSKTIKICVSAQAVCAVILGAQVRRLHAGRFRGGACEIEGFNELPLFSKLVIYLTGRSVKAKTGFAVDDRADLATATALAANVAPSRHEVEQLLRLAGEEAERIIGQRWTVVQQLADTVAQRGELTGDQVSRIVHQTRKKPAVTRRPERAPSAGRPGMGRTRAPWVIRMLSHCAAVLGTGTGKRGQTNLSNASRRTDARKDPGRSSDRVRKS